MKIATWNVNSLRPRLDHLARYASEAQPDVLCLQETKVVDEDFPHMACEAAGYPHRAIFGQKTYNGVAILSKRPLSDVATNFTLGPPDEQARVIRARVAGVLIINVYVPNGSPINSPKFSYKLDWYARMRAELDAIATPDEPVLLCGDMNVAPTDADVYDPFETQGQVLCSAPERQALKDLTGWGLTDAWRKKNPFAPDYSWWDYRGGGFRYNHGFRIDHVYLSRPAMRRCAAAGIDRDPRTWDRPSDHTPVWVKLKDEA